MKAQTNTPIDPVPPGSLLGVDEAPVPKVFGRYIIEKELGKGAMGVVYLAEDTQLHRKVALKIPKKSALESPDNLERFYREARTTATLRHSNICPVFDVGNIDGTHYITMAFIPGKPISSFLGKGKLPRARQVALLIRKIALALEEAHRNGVIHRDLKPSNVMLDDRSEPIVMDFGLARNMNTAEDARITQTGAILGTPAYMAPEQVRGDQKRIGPQSDIYALGVMMYQFLTGELPFNGPMMTVFSQILSSLPKRPSELRPDVDPTLEAICGKMMAKEIDQRFASMKDIATELAEYHKQDSVKGQQSATIVSEPDSNLEGLPTIPDVTFEEYKPDSPNTLAVRLSNLWNRGRTHPWFWPVAALIGLSLLGLFALIDVPPTESIAPANSPEKAARTDLVSSVNDGKTPRRQFLPVGTVYTGTTRFFQPDIDQTDRSSEFTITITRRERNWVEAKGELHQFNKTWIYQGFCTDSGDENGDILIEDVNCVGEENPAEGITTMVVRIRDQGETLRGVGFVGLECSEFSGTLQRGESPPDDTDSKRPQPAADASQMAAISQKVFPLGATYAGTWQGYPAGSTVATTDRGFNVRITRRDNAFADAVLHLEDPEQDWSLKGRIVRRDGQAPILLIQDVDLVDGDHPLEGRTTLLFQLSEDGTEFISRGLSTIGLRSEASGVLLANQESPPEDAAANAQAATSLAFPSGATFRGVWKNFSAGQDVADAETELTVTVTQRKGASFAAEWFMKERSATWLFKGNISARDQGGWTLKADDIDLIGADHPNEGNTSVVAELGKDGKQLHGTAFYQSGARSEFEAALVRPPDHQRPSP